MNPNPNITSVKKKTQRQLSNITTTKSMDTIVTDSWWARHKNKIKSDNDKEIKDPTSITSLLKDIQLTALNLSNKNINQTDLTAIANAFSYPNLTSLDLGYNRVGDRQALFIVGALQNTNLTNLNLSCNDISDQGIVPIITALKTTQITSLSLYSNAIRETGARAIASALKDTRIVSLNLGLNTIGQEGTRALADSLKDSPLVELNVSNNGIGNEGTIFVANILRHTRITTLNLKGNAIGRDGISAIAGVLKYTRLISLNLENNCIGKEEIRIIATALEKSKITTLYLGYNGIDDDGCEIIINASKKSRITNLYLNVNAIGDKGGRIIGNNLKDNQFGCLNLKDNYIGKKGAKFIVDVLKDTYITVLELEGNDKGWDVPGISSILETNQTKLENVYQNLSNLISVGNEGVKFVVGNENSTAREYIDLTELVSKKKQRFMDYFVGCTGDGIKNFIENIEIELAEFLYELDLALIERVKLLLSCEERGLKLVVNKLLDRRYNYLLVELEEKEHALHGILHPAVCVLMYEYGKPWCFETMKPTENDLIRVCKSKEWDGIVLENELGEFRGDWTRRRVLEILGDEAPKIKRNRKG